MQLYDLSDDNINIIIPFLDLKYVFNFCCTNLKNLNHNQSYLKKIIIFHFTTFRNVCNFEGGVNHQFGPKCYEIITQILSDFIRSYQILIILILVCYHVLFIFYQN